ncbi:MAG: hypothetical protein J6Y85_04280 [Alphaproteobacteria bacterium]|nr:hypothetical protein [Alphaproteobacteria bacterium]
MIKQQKDNHKTILPRFRISWKDNSFPDYQIWQQFDRYCRKQGKQTHFLKLINSILFINLDIRGKCKEEWIAALTPVDSEKLFNRIEQLTKNPFVLAKIFNILWLRKLLNKNNYIAAQKSCSYYLRCVNLCIKYNSYVSAAHYFEIYFNLAASLGGDSLAAQQA